MKIDRKLARGYPQPGNYVLVNGEHIGKTVTKDYDYINLTLLYHNDLKVQDVKVVNQLTNEELKQLEEDKPHLFM